MAGYRITWRGRYQIKQTVPSQRVIRSVETQMLDYLQSTGLHTVKGATPVITGRLQRGWRVKGGSGGGRLSQVTGRIAASFSRKSRKFSLDNPTPYASNVFEGRGTTRKDFNRSRIQKAKRIIDRGIHQRVRAGLETAIRKDIRL